MKSPNNNSNLLYYTCLLYNGPYIFTWYLPSTIIVVVVEIRRGFYLCVTYYFKGIFLMQKN